jgi:hypothetical protein
MRTESTMADIEVAAAEALKSQRLPRTANALGGGIRPYPSRSTARPLRRCAVRSRTPRRVGPDRASTDIGVSATLTLVRCASGTPHELVQTIVGKPTST